MSIFLAVELTINYIVLQKSPDLNISLSDVERFLEDLQLSEPIQPARARFFSHGSDEK